MPELAVACLELDRAAQGVEHAAADDVAGGEGAEDGAADTGNRDRGEPRAGAWMSMGAW